MSRRRSGVAVLILVLLGACDGGGGAADRQVDPADLEHELSLFADLHLSDNTLEGLAPPGFTVNEVKRYGPDRHQEDWLTVGARMDGPIPFARAIYYVHPTAEAAGEMYTDQAGLTKGSWRRLRDGTFTRGLVPRPFPVLDSIPTLCGVRVDNLYWCHGVADRVYLVIQSSAGADPAQPRTINASTRDDAIALTKAFGSYLNREF